MLTGTSSGGVCLNDTVLHIGVPDLPFGGVGQSGMGSYHGKYSFENFSHFKALLDKSTIFESDLKYYGHSDKQMSLIQKLS